MTLRKTLRLEQYATENGYSNVRYDQECVGLSSGQQTTIEFEHWVEDALAMVDHVCRGPVVLVASSLGSWISVLVAQRRPERIHGMIFLGPGFNCLRPGYWYILGTQCHNHQQLCTVFQLGSVAGSVIQATGTVEFEDGLRTGVLPGGCWCPCGGRT